MGLLPEMMHPVCDAIRFAKDEPPAQARGEGFVWFAERLLQRDRSSSADLSKALKLMCTAAELGAPRAHVWLASSSRREEGDHKSEPSTRAALVGVVIGNT
jgi:hypothetical protein